MNKIKVSFFAAFLAMGFVACNNDDSESTTSTDSSTLTTTENTATTTNTSTTDYAALADTFNTNSEAGVYLNPRTGKSMKIKVDPQTGMRTDVTTGEPVWRYVDKRTWWVYGGDSWDSQGEAKMEGNKIIYKGDDDSWVDYDKRWPDDEKMQKDWKTKIGDTKIKVSKDGDVKIKDEKGKTKIDGDDGKVKIDSSQ
jgi:hypothetical protein